MKKTFAMWSEVKWSEVTPIFKEGKHMTVLTQTDKLVALILQCHYKKIRIYIYEKILTI